MKYVLNQQITAIEERPVIWNESLDIFTKT